MSDEYPRASYTVPEGRAIILADFPDWEVSYSGFQRTWIARSPDFKRDGISVQAKYPEDTVARVQRLLAVWQPKRRINGYACSDVSKSCPSCDTLALVRDGTGFKCTHCGSTVGPG